MTSVADSLSEIATPRIELLDTDLPISSAVRVYRTRPARQVERLRTPAGSALGTAWSIMAAWMLIP